MENNISVAYGCLRLSLVLPVLLFILCSAKGDNSPLPVHATLAEWKQAMFSREALADGTADNNASPAGDGVSNLLKYAFELDPFEPVSRSAFTRSSIENDHLTLEYFQFPQKTDILYTPEVTGDLGSETTWLDGEDFIETFLISENDDGSQLMAAEDKELASQHDKRFMRLNIVRINPDTDGDQMPDDWELKHFGEMDLDGSEWAEGIEGMTVLDAWMQGYNPNHFYEGTNAKLMQISGNRQRVAPTVELAPLEVVVFDAVTEIPLVNAPVIFQVAIGDGAFSGPSILRTDSLGRAKAHLIAPAAISTNIVQAVIGSDHPENHTEFITESAAPEAPTHLRGELLPGGEGIKLKWQDNSDIETGYIIEMKSYDGTWIEVGDVPENATEFDYVFTNPPPAN